MARAVILGETIDAVAVSMEAEINAVELDTIAEASLVTCLISSTRTRR